MRFVPNHKFVLTAATVTFREGRTVKEGDQVLLVHNINPKYDETFYTLPGGRKNIGEKLEDAAIRETLEETGFRVRVPPASILTRATRDRALEWSRLVNRGWDNRFPQPDSSLKSLTIEPARASLHSRSGPPTIRDVINDCSKEPVGMITYSDPLAEGACMKLRFFFYAILVDADLQPSPPDLDFGEHVEAVWVTVKKALGMLRFQAEREVVQTAHAVHKCSGPRTGECDPFYKKTMHGGLMQHKHLAKDRIDHVMRKTNADEEYAFQKLRENGDDATRAIEAIESDLYYDTV